MTSPIVTIRRYVDSTGKRGYRWNCQQCRNYGIHRFDRWTDRRLAEYGRVDAHPWRRCMDAADDHVRRHHRPAPHAVHVHLHIGGVA